MEKYSETLSAIAQAKANITKSEAAWLSFLNTSAQMYKHPFDYQVRINSVCPKAVACADFQTWTADIKLNRHIKKGAHGIPVIDTTAKNAARVYLFDISDTEERSNGKSKTPFVWSADERHYEAIRDGISTRYGFTAVNIEGAIREIAEMVAENTAKKCYDELSSLGSELPREEVEQLICGSVSHVLLTRCGLSTEKNSYSMSSITALHSAGLAETFGRILTSETSVLLKQIEIIVKGHEAELQKERNEHENDRNSDRERDAASTEQGGRGVLPRHENGVRNDVHSGREGGEISVLSPERQRADTAGDNAADESRADERSDSLGGEDSAAAGAGRVHGSGDRSAAIGGADEVREAGRVYEAERPVHGEREVRGTSQGISDTSSAEAAQGNDGTRNVDRSSDGNSDERGAAGIEDNGAVGEVRGNSDGAVEIGEPHALGSSDEQLSESGGGNLHSGDGLQRGTDDRETSDISTTAGAAASAVSVPENGIIGNIQYRYIPKKTYRKLDTETALAIAAALQQNDIKYSGNVKKTSTTLTVSADNAPIVDKLIYDMKADKSVYADVSFDGSRWYLSNQDGEPLKYYNRKHTPLNEVELNFATIQSLERIEANSREFLEETAKVNPTEAIYIRAHIEELTERIVNAHIQLGLYTPDAPEITPEAPAADEITRVPESAQTVDVEIENIRAYCPVSPDEPQLYQIRNSDYSVNNQDLALIHGAAGNRTVEYLQNVSEPVREHIERLAERLPNRFVMPEPAAPRRGEPMVTINYSEHSDIPDKPVTMPFSQANAILGYLDMQQHNTREDKEIGSGWYHKTDFTITYMLDGEEHSYEGRYDLGDGEGSLLAHVRDFLDYYKKPDYRNMAASSGEKGLEEYERNIVLSEKLINLLEQYQNVQSLPQGRDYKHDTIRDRNDSEDILRVVRTAISDYRDCLVCDGESDWGYDWDDLKTAFKAVLSSNSAGFNNKIAEHLYGSNAEEILRKLGNGDGDILADSDLNFCIAELNAVLETPKKLKKPIYRQADNQMSLFDSMESLQQEKPAPMNAAPETEITFEAPERQKSVDELQVGDIVRYDGGVWKIAEIDGDFSVKFENTDKNSIQSVRGIIGHWKEQLAKDGFEYLVPKINVTEKDMENESNIISADDKENRVRNAFQKLKENHDFSPEVIKLLERVENHIVKFDEENFSSKIFKLPLFERTYGSVSRVNEKLFDGGLKAVINEVNGYMAAENKDIAAETVTANPESTEAEQNREARHITAAELSVGDKFILDGDEYTVTDTNLGIYPDDVVITKIEKSADANISYAVTSNIDKHKLISEGQYLGNSEREAEEKLKALEAETALTGNFRITDENLGAGGAKAKYKANVEAIKLLKELEFAGRTAAPDEQEILSRYVGWGGIPQAFDENNGEWANEFKELYTLLSPDEYESARASTLNAHYTSPTVINAVYEGLENLGFKGGKVLEPAMGVGNFFGAMPQSMADKSKLYGVELDDISGRIAKQLYPNADIQVTGYEHTAFPDSFFDVAVGNVPFGGYKLNEKRYNKLNLNIHDHFFVKSLDKVREGGVVAFVTSKGTLDKENPAVRKYLAERAELLGAIRLPNTAFKANAGTEVTSDIIFLQKRDKPLDIEPDWVHLGKTIDGLPVNQYFIDHPEMVLGKIVQGNKLYGRGGDDTMCVPIEGADLKEQLKQAVANIKGQIPEAAVNIEQREKSPVESAQTIPADPNVKNFSYTVVDDKVYYRENDEMILQELHGSTEDRIKGLVDIRDCVRRLIDLQLNEYSESDIAEQQAKLNKMYDGFVKQNGRINSVANKRAFKNDDSFYLLASLEVLDENGEFDRKADMFSKRTIKQYKEVTQVDTAVEALAISIAEKAGVDLPFMSELCSKTEDEIISDLQGVIFPVPFSDHGNGKKYQTADEYLSGNIREKLRIAEQAASISDDFKLNVSELKRVMPEPLKAADIEMRLGSTLIPPIDITRFMLEVLKTPLDKAADMKVEFSRYTSEWHINSKKSDPQNVLANVTYGTERKNAYEIIEDSLNLRDTRVYDQVETPDGKIKSVLNQKETELAQQKQTAIKEAFKNWIFKDPERRERLVKKYNEVFNSVRPREYDGSHLTFPGMNPEITMRPHQLNAIAHTLYGGNTLLAHVVGAGKTYEMIASAMEGKRLGLHNKALFCVPNHLTEQMGSDFMQLYPSANILVATEQDFTPQNRKRLCAKIATGDYDAVIIGHSQLEKIPISIERQEQMIRRQINEITDNIKSMNRDNGFNVKQLEKTKKNLKARLKALTEMKRDDVVTFEELGVDKLYVDEAHNFKNLFLYTKMRNVAGLQQTEAQKSTDLYMKCQYMDELTGGKGTVFATGTPVSNSMTELYTMMRYLQSDTLSKMQLQHFDAWAANFGESVTAMELAPEGNTFRMKTRFSKFFNLPELMNTFKEAADIKTSDMLDLPVPEARFHNIVVEPTPEQTAMVKELSARATAIHKKLVTPDKDNMLKITSDGRKIGLDQRLINPLMPDNPQSKVNVCIDNIYDIYKKTEDRRSTQLVFCDFSTPNGKGFNLYDDIRDKLIARGVPKEEVAFIHEAKTEAKKKELFAKVRSGQVRVLIGSTAKCGAGTNVQNKLVALHHLDCPWRPSDLEQREGRIIRQGNENIDLGGVDIYRYVTNATFDAYLYQTIENKQKFISQIMTSKSPVRSCEDMDETVLSYAEVKALCAGNPLIKEKMELDVEVTRLKLAKAAYNNERYALEDKAISELPLLIKEAEGRLKGFTEDNDFLKAQPPTSVLILGDKVYTDRESAGQALIDAALTVSPGAVKEVGEYRGFKVSIHLNAVSKQYELHLSHKMTYTCELGSNALGNITRINNLLGKIEDREQTERDRIENYSTQIKAAKEELKKPFEHEQELEQKTARLDEVNAKLAALENEEADKEARTDSPMANENGTKSAKEFKPDIKPQKKPSILKQIKELQAEQRAKENDNNPENSKDNLDVG